MAYYLEVIYTLHGSENVFLGAVAAWGKETHPSPGSPTGERTYQVLKGLADPIMAAQLVEEAIHDDGFVWVIGLDGPETRKPLPAKLENLLLIWGGDIHSGRVCPIGSGVDGSPPGNTEPPATGGNSPSNDLGPGDSTSPALAPNPPISLLDPNVRR